MPDVVTEDRNAGDTALCVLKVVQMVEALRRSPAGLRAEQLLTVTGYSRSSVYRMLKTLAGCGYILRDGEGTYHLNQTVIRSAEGGPAEFERWVSGFRRTGEG